FFESSGADPVRLYRTIIEDVIENSIEFFVEEGVEKTVLRDLKKLWELKLLQSNAVGSFPVDNQLLLLKAHVHFLQIPCSTIDDTPKTLQTINTPSYKQTKQLLINSRYLITLQMVTLKPRSHLRHIRTHWITQKTFPSIPQSRCQIQTTTTRSSDLLEPNARSLLFHPTARCVPPQRELASLQRSASQLAVLEELELAVTGCVSAHKNIGLMSRLEHTRFKHVKTVMLVRSSSAMSTLTRGRLFFGSEKARRDADELPLLLQLDGAEDSSEEPEGHDLSSTTTTSSDDSDGVDDMDAKFLEEELVVEEDPLNSGDDVSEQDNSEMFDVDNVVVCQYDKIHRSKNKWKFHFKDGIMNLDGLDYFFSKLAGDAEW
uniref:General transcription factor IIA, 1-like n=1 Tax=Petromyzon marinus TaxID=7757 RepID=S4R6Q7_PETMA